MKKLICNTEVSDRSYYYLLDFNERDNHKAISQISGQVQLKMLTFEQYKRLFTIATQPQEEFKYTAPAKLHIVTPLFRYKTLQQVFNSIPDHPDIVWHIAKIQSRNDLPDYTFLKSDKVKLYNLPVADNDIVFKRNHIFDIIQHLPSYFHLLDDDTEFHGGMLDLFLHLRETGFVGMAIGRQVDKNNKTRLQAAVPKNMHIDTGNVLCHASVLKTGIRWAEVPNPLATRETKDYVFWKKIYDHYGPIRTRLFPDITVSKYNSLKKFP